MARGFSARSDPIRVDVAVAQDLPRFLLAGRARVGLSNARCYRAPPLLLHSFIDAGPVMNVCRKAALALCTSARDVSTRKSRGDGLDTVYLWRAGVSRTWPFGLRRLAHVSEECCAVATRARKRSATASR